MHIFPSEKLRNNSKMEYVVFFYEFTCMKSRPITLLNTFFHGYISYYSLLHSVFTKPMQSNSIAQPALTLSQNSECNEESYQTRTWPDSTVSPSISRVFRAVL